MGADTNSLGGLLKAMDAASVHRATTVSLFGCKVPIAGVDDLLAMKRNAGRPKDQIDIMALEKIKRGENPNE